MKSLDPIRMGRIILALALALALGACSAIKLGYTSLPELAYWWLDGFADFNDTQRAQVRAELAKLHGWHRQQELPKVAELLGRMEQMVPGDISPQQACALLSEARARMDAVADVAEPAVVSVATSLTGRQLRHMERKFRSSNDNFRKDNIDLPAHEAMEKRYEQMLDRLEMIYGRLDAPQRAVLKQGVAHSAYDAARILADRQRRQQDLLQTLRLVTRADASPAEARPQLRAWLDRAQHSPDAAYRTWQEGLVQEGCRIFSAVHRSTTPAQREQAVKRLRAYQRDLRELSASR